MDINSVGSSASGVAQTGSVSIGAGTNNSAGNSIGGNVGGSAASVGNSTGSGVTAVAGSPASGSVTGTSATSTTGSTSTPSLAQVKAAVKKINDSLNANGNGQDVQFAVDPGSKRVVVQVLDAQTNKVIRQIPSEEIIQMSQTLGQKLGNVINQQA